MSRVEIQRVHEKSGRDLPIFAECERIADQIRLEAFNLFAHRGAGEGHALDDWLEAEQRFCWPAAELAESEDGFLLKVAMAGFEPKEVSVTATPHELLVKATHQQKASGGDDEARTRWSEFRSNDVLRRVELPAAVDVNKISASLKNGMLEVAAPKTGAMQETTRKI